MPAPTMVRRRLGQLGGTTNWGDCLTALRLLGEPARLVDGGESPAYERAFAAAAGARHAVSFAHGRVALYALLRAFGVGPGDEVLVPVPTHVVVANAVRYTGAKPVFVDCLPESWNMDLAAAERLANDRTRALLLQHTFGTPADVDRALDLGWRRGIRVIEDCVHALGARHRDRPVGSFGDAAFFSTEETKTISSTMGGMAVTSDDAVAAAVREFHACCGRPERGLAARYMLKLAGYHVLTQPHAHRLTRPAYEALGRRNPLPGATTPEEREGRRPADHDQRLSNAQAVVALRQLRRLDANVAHRRRIAAVYAARLGPLGAPPPAAHPGDEPALLRYPVRVPDRPAAVRALAPHAVPGLWFTSVLEEATDPLQLGYFPGACPVAEDAARHLVNLPCHPRVTERDAERIADAVAGELA